jgi:hypothetical protein
VFAAHAIVRAMTVRRTRATPRGLCVLLELHALRVRCITQTVYHSSSRYIYFTCDVVLSLELRLSYCQAAHDIS